MCIDHITTEYDPDTKQIRKQKIKLADRNKSIEQIIKILRLDNNNSIEHEISDETIKELSKIFYDSPRLKKSS